MTEAEVVIDPPPLPISIGAVRILSASIELDPTAEAEVDVSWGTRADQMTGSTIYVLGVLQAKGEKARTSVYVALVCTATEPRQDEFTEEDMRALAASRSVVHVLYDTAASVARQLLAIVQSDGRIPPITPAAAWLPSTDLDRTEQH